MNDSRQNMILVWLILVVLAFTGVHLLERLPLTSQPTDSQGQDVDLGGY